MTPEETKAFIECVYASYSDAELDSIESVTFHHEVVAVAKEFTKFADAIAQHFDPEVIVAALEVVLNDFSQHVDHEGDEHDGS